MGGLGHLSRSLGLTIDNIVALKGVRGDGSVFEVFEGCADPIAWHWLRGAAPFLAVITEATLRTHPRQPLLVRRSLAAVETLAEHLQQAEGLSRQWSSSFVLGVPPDGSEPALMRYLVGAELDESHCPVAGASGVRGPIECPAWMRCPPLICQRLMEGCLLLICRVVTGISARGPGSMPSALRQVSRKPWPRC